MSTDQRELYIRKFGETLDELTEIGVQRILVLGAVPVMSSENPSACVLRAERYGKDVVDACGSDASDYERRSREYVSRIEEAIAGRENVRIIDPRAALCDGAGRCSPLDDGFLKYRDDDHVNDVGAALIYRHFRSEFDWVFGTR